MEISKYCHDRKLLGEDVVQILTKMQPEITLREWNRDSKKRHFVTSKTA